MERNGIMYCENCGKEISDDAKFCDHCGGSVSAPGQSAPVVIPASTPAGQTVSAGPVCPNCGKEVSRQARACPGCGQPILGDSSPKSQTVVVILAFFLGVFGIHRFYVGKNGTAILQLLTFGGLGIWAFIDFIIAACGAFTDSDGRKITNWQ
jgi:RNA polymerase subunit RPABC4/transcription elongation factor Spt4